MTNRLKISLFIPLYRRFERLAEIIEAWAAQVDEIVLWQNDHNHESRRATSHIRADLLAKTKIIRAEDNYGGQIKFMAANLLQHEHVLIADDDIIPKPELVDDIRAHFDDLSVTHNPNNLILTTFGRNFGPDGYRAHNLVSSKKVSTPVEVDFAGRMYFGHRGNFLVDMHGATDTRLDDLYWLRALRRAKSVANGNAARVYVFPTDKWSNIPGRADEHSISKMAGYWDARDEFVKDNLPFLIRPARLADAIEEAPTPHERVRCWACMDTGYRDWDPAHGGDRQSPCINPECENRPAAIA